MSAAKVPLPAGGDAAPLPAAASLTRLIYQASHAGRRLRRLLADHIVGWNLSDNEFFVLWFCHEQREHGRGQGELAAAMGVSPAQMSSLVEGLRQRNLIAVQRATGDRRRQVWQIASTGETLLGEITSCLAELAAQLDRHLLPAEQSTAADLFQRLAQLAVEESPLRLYEPPAALADQSGGADHA